MWPTLNALRTETLVGQYLDLRATGRPSADLDVPWQIIRYKTAKYTFEYPLRLGALLAGATPEQLAALSDYALPLGDAFQLRDDLLGVFGDPGRTRKSAYDDLSEGKHTVLIATALRHATTAQGDTLRGHLGRPGLRPEAVEEIRDILTASGAHATVERIIHDRREQALTTLATAPIHRSARDILSALALTMTHRAA